MNKRKHLLWGMITSVALLACAQPAQAVDYRASLDQRITASQDIMRQIMQSPDKSIPEELLAKCKAIAIYLKSIKGVFIFGGRYGQGIIIKKDENTGLWGPVSFSILGSGNVGFQIGGQVTDLILVIMNDRGLNSLMSDHVTLGGDVSVAAGPVGRYSSGNTDLLLRASIVSYSRSWGLFAGISLDGAIVGMDSKANAAYYGRPVTNRDILFGNAVPIAPGSQPLIADLNDYSSRWAKNPRPSNQDTTSVTKFDFEGQISNLDIAKGEIVVLDTRPMNERVKGDAAWKRIKVDSLTLSRLRIGDRVKILFRPRGPSLEAQQVIKVRP